jgi:hypothetical protein
VGSSCDGSVHHVLEEDDLTMTHAIFEHAGPLTSLSATQVVLAISEHAWPATLVMAIWWALRTRVVRAAAWIWLLRRQGVSKAKCGELITGAMKRDLGLRDPPAT